MKTLVLYGTRGGATRQSAELIAGRLSEMHHHETELVDTRDFHLVKKRMSDFDNIVIGSSIRSGMWVSKCLGVLKKLKDPDQKLFVFVSAGGTMHKPEKYGISRDEARGEAINKYIDKYLDKYGIEVSLKTAFGGWVMKKEALRYKSWLEDEVVNWAEEIAAKS